MKITQYDIADLSDTAAKRIVIALLGDEPRPLRLSFRTRLAHALMRAVQERERLLATAELELLNDDGAMGALVAPGDDPVEDARRQLREGPLP